MMNDILNKYDDFKNKIELQLVTDPEINNFINDHIIFFKNLILDTDGLKYNISRYYYKFIDVIGTYRYQNLTKIDFLSKLEEYCWKISNNFIQKKEINLDNKDILRSFYGKLTLGFLLTYHDFMECKSELCVYQTINKFLFIVRSESLFEVLKVKKILDDTCKKIMSFIVEPNKFYQLINMDFYWRFYIKDSELNHHTMKELVKYNDSTVNNEQICDYLIINNTKISNNKSKQCCTIS